MFKFLTIVGLNSAFASTLSATTLSDFNFVKRACRNLLNTFPSSVQYPKELSTPQNLQRTMVSGHIVEPIGYENGEIGAVSVTSPDGKTIIFERTHRSLARYRESLNSKFLSREFLRDKKVLDVGTGPGDAVYDMRKIGADAHGLDIYLSTVQKQSPFFHQSHLNKLPFESESFDVVITFYSVFLYGSYLKNEQQFDSYLQYLNEMSRVTKKGGIIIISPHTGIRDLLQASPNLTILEQRNGTVVLLKNLL